LEVLPSFPLLFPPMIELVGERRRRRRWGCIFFFFLFFIARFCEEVWRIFFFFFLFSLVGVIDVISLSLFALSHRGQ